MYVFFFQVQLDHFVPMEFALFVQQLRTEKQTGNVASAQNGCAKDHSIETIQIK